MAYTRLQTNQDIGNMFGTDTSGNVLAGHTGSDPTKRRQQYTDFSSQYASNDLFAQLADQNAGKGNYFSVNQNVKNYKPTLSGAPGNNAAIQNSGYGLAEKYFDSYIQGQDITQNADFKSADPYAQQAALTSLRGWFSNPAEYIKRTGKASYQRFQAGGTGKLGETGPGVVAGVSGVTPYTDKTGFDAALAKDAAMKPPVVNGAGKAAGAAATTAYDTQMGRGPAGATSLAEALANRAQPQAGYVSPQKNPNSIPGNKPPQQVTTPTSPLAGAAGVVAQQGIPAAGTGRPAGESAQSLFERIRRGEITPDPNNAQWNEMYVNGKPTQAQIDAYKMWNDYNTGADGSSSLGDYTVNPDGTMGGGSGSDGLPGTEGMDGTAGNPGAPGAPAPTTGDDLFKKYFGEGSKLQSYEPTMNDLEGQLAQVSTSLRHLDQDVTDRYKDFKMTESQRRAIENKERSALAQQAADLGDALKPIEAAYNKELEIAKLGYNGEIKQQSEFLQQQKLDQAAKKTALATFSNFVKSGIEMPIDMIASLAADAGIPLEQAWQFNVQAKQIADNKQLTADGKDLANQVLQEKLDQYQAGIFNSKQQNIQYYMDALKNGAPPDQLAFIKKAFGITDMDDPLYQAKVALTNAQQAVSAAKTDGTPEYGTAQYWANQKAEVDLQLAQARYNELTGGSSWGTGGSTYIPTGSKYSVTPVSENEVHFNLNSTADLKAGRTQCGELVNDMLGLGTVRFGDTPASKQAMVNSSAPVAGGAFIMQNLGSNGHVGMIEKVGKDASGNVTSMTIVDSNRNMDGQFRRTTITPASAEWKKITGFFDPNKPTSAGYKPVGQNSADFTKSLDDKITSQYKLYQSGIGTPTAFIDNILKGIPSNQQPQAREYVKAKVQQMIDQGTLSKLGTALGVKPLLDILGIKIPAGMDFTKAPTTSTFIQDFQTALDSWQPNSGPNGYTQ